jgi:ADP-ribose pyrophosphatase YjhB (NUDIX family)
MNQDKVGSGDRWIPEDEYTAITKRVPILCVDVLPLRTKPHPAIGLIFRETYNGGRGWCLVGGAVLHNEPLPDALRRHVSTTLGQRASIEVSTLELADVIEYFTEPNIGDFYDPRKHAVALTYIAEVKGSVVPMGEALKFQWFAIEEPPEPNSFGFGQERVVQRLLRYLRDRAPGLLLGTNGDQADD